MTEEIINALNHVKETVDKRIDTVIFLKDVTWLYMISETGEIPIFPDNVDVSILEEAIDSVNELPAIFQLDEQAARTTAHMLKNNQKQFNLNDVVKIVDILWTEPECCKDWFQDKMTTIDAIKTLLKNNLDN
jgi:hypothetical protein